MYVTSIKSIYGCFLSKSDSSGEETLGSKAEDGIQVKSLELKNLLPMVAFDQQGHHTDIERYPNLLRQMV